LLLSLQRTLAAIVRARAQAAAGPKFAHAVPRQNMTFMLRFELFQPGRRYPEPGNLR
jgi:hypothetical protein